MAPSMDITHSLVMGAAAGFIGPLGDLTESLIKRKTGVKDSGKIIPGHGGVLDRLDSHAFCAMVFYIYMTAAIYN